MLEEMCAMVADRRKIKQGKAEPDFYGTRKVFHGRYIAITVAPCKHLTGVVKLTTETAFTGTKLGK